MKDNSILEATSLLEYVKGTLCVDSRVQLSRTVLESTQRLLGQIINKLTGKGNRFNRINFYLLGVHDLVATILDDSNFDRTDTETKEMIAGKVNDALEMLYVEAGRFYDTEHDFEYHIGIDNLLQTIIQKSIASGYYFGQEVSQA